MLRISHGNNVFEVACDHADAMPPPLKRGGANEDCEVKHWKIAFVCNVFKSRMFPTEVSLRQLAA
ncbi:hypothetical protein BH11VER1_BH11VER1_33270 [soil metagenome]